MGLPLPDNNKQRLDDGCPSDQPEGLGRFSRLSHSYFLDLDTIDYWRVENGRPSSTPTPETAEIVPAPAHTEEELRAFGEEMIRRAET